MFQFLVRSLNDQVEPKDKPRVTLPEKEFIYVLDAKFQEACGRDSLTLFLTVCLSIPSFFSLFLLFIVFSMFDIQLFTEKAGLPVMTQEDFRQFLLLCYETASGKNRDESEETDFILNSFVMSAVSYGPFPVDLTF